MDHRILISVWDLNPTVRTRLWVLFGVGLISCKQHSSKLDMQGRWRSIYDEHPWLIHAFQKKKKRKTAWNSSLSENLMQGCLTCSTFTRFCKKLIWSDNCLEKWNLIQGYILHSKSILFHFPPFVYLVRFIHSWPKIFYLVVYYGFFFT